jgi:hypothetical protein
MNIFKQFALLGAFISMALLADADCPTLTATPNVISCYGASTGTITATASGGAGGYTFNLNGGAYRTSGTFTNLVAGTYTVGVKDRAGCITTQSAYVNQYSEIGIVITQANINCTGTASGEINVNAEGISQMLYSLNGGPYQTSNIFNNLVSGTYTVTVKDGLTCTKSVNVSLTQPAGTPVTINTTQTNPGCSGSATGTITASAAGGSGSYTYSLNGSPYQQSGLFSNLTAGTYTISVQDGSGCPASKTVILNSTPIAQTCSLGYPDNSNLPRSAADFNENEVLVASDPVYTGSCVTSATKIRVWYSDEHAMTLGVRSVSVKTATGTTTTNYPITTAPTTSAAAAFHPLVGSTVASGDQSGNDLAVDGGRPLWPALFITDVTFNAGNRSGDWQQGGTGVAPSAVYGTWKGAVKLIDKTRTPVKVTVTPDADPAYKNKWDLAGGDAPPAGSANQGYGTEVVWELADLGLIEGHSYHLQFMVHDGDQNKTGGDVGEACTTIYVPLSNDNKTSGIGTVGSENFNVKVYPNPSSSNFNLRVSSIDNGPMDIKIMDMTGKVVQESNNLELEKEHQIGGFLSPGLYLVEVKQGDTKRIVRVTKD